MSDTELMDNSYGGLLDADVDHRYAYGTGFADPLAGVDPTVPDDVERGALSAACLALGDDALVLSHRLQQWVTRAPELEEETALANVALDLLGQARLLLTRAGQADGSGHDEDWFAFRRSASDLRNVRLVERGDADFAELVARLLVFSTWRLAAFERLRACADPVLAAVCGRGVSELAYHREYAAGWVVRLGDGTETSHSRMQAALATAWPYLDELLSGDLMGVDVAALRPGVEGVLGEVLAQAGLPAPVVAADDGGGRAGRHTPALDEVLEELQSVAREHPEATW
ncbi:MAG TPA: 1,2-phenylacetyl-CoA epoxidase subunit PaaC [Mycobacteriales bacterium]